MNYRFMKEFPMKISKYFQLRSQENYKTRNSFEIFTTVHQQNLYSQIILFKQRIKNKPIKELDKSHNPPGLRIICFKNPRQVYCSNARDEVDLISLINSSQIFCCLNVFITEE